MGRIIIPGGGNNVDLDVITAAASDILKGKIGIGPDGEPLTGTIPSLSAKTITPGKTNQVLNAGNYLAGNITVKGDSNLAAANIKSGKSIFGVSGSCKEFKVYAYRFLSSIENVESIKIKAKFNGATGNYSAILTAFPNLDWPVLAKKFVEEYLGLTFNPLTTQIESHDYTCHILDGVRHFNNVLVDFDVDMWLYISMEYFKQIPVKGEVGSSTMPHKVNPIRFENSEANIDMSNNICVALSNKLPKSRMQRDLSDSSSQRNLGLAFGYSLQAMNETINGLAKCVVNKEKLASDLNEKWEVLAEPIQTMLRKYGVPDAYDTLKALTRGKSISKEDILKFAESLEILSDEDRQTLVEMTPASYIGLANKLAKLDLNK